MIKILDGGTLFELNKIQRQKAEIDRNNINKINNGHIKEVFEDLDKRGQNM